MNSKSTETDNTKLFGIKRKLVTGCGNTHLIAFFETDTGDLKEVFYMKGSTGGCTSSYTAISRLISIASRNGIPIKPIIDQLLSTEPCPSYRTRTVVKKDTSKGTSCANAIGYALTEMAEDAKRMVKDKTLNLEESTSVVDDDDLDNTVSYFTDSRESVLTPEPTKQGAKTYILKTNTVSDNDCPDCGAHLAYSGGCMVCNTCGWSRCG